MLEQGEPAIVENPREDPRFYAGMDEASGFRRARESLPPAPLTL